MEERVARCRITYGDDKITITGLAKDVEVDSSADINITPLVEELVVALDSFDKINYEFDGFGNIDKRHGIIKNAILSAFDAYNETVSTDAQTDSSESDLF